MIRFAFSANYKNKSIKQSIYLRVMKQIYQRFLQLWNLRIWSNLAQQKSRIDALGAGVLQEGADKHRFVHSEKNNLNGELQH